jgi:hypothetical protein
MRRTAERGSKIAELDRLPDGLNGGVNPEALFRLLLYIADHFLSFAVRRNQCTKFDLGGVV